MGDEDVLILFVEYHAAFRQSTSHVMGREPDMEVVSQAGTVAEGRERMAEGGIDAAIVDVPLPDEGAEEMVGELRGANPAVPVLVMTSIKGPEVRGRFLGAGANEVLGKDATFPKVLAAVRRLGRGGAEEMFLAPGLGEERKGELVGAIEGVPATAAVPVLGLSSALKADPDGRTAPGLPWPWTAEALAGAIERATLAPGGRGAPSS